MEITATVQGVSNFLGFPLTVSRRIPQGEAHLVLPKDAGNVSGEMEIHAGSFIGLPGSTVKIYLRGRLLTTVTFTDDPEDKQPDIANELNAFLEQGETVH